MREVVALLSRCSTITCTLVGTIAIVHKSQLFTNVTIATNTNRKGPHSGGGRPRPNQQQRAAHTVRRPVRFAFALPKAFLYRLVISSCLRRSRERHLHELGVGLVHVHRDRARSRVNRRDGDVLRRPGAG